MRVRTGGVRRSALPIASSVIASCVIASLALGPSATAAPFQTDGRPQVVGLAAGVTLTPILTTGDVADRRFQFSGNPDGIGVYELRSVWEEQP